MKRYRIIAVVTFVILVVAVGAWKTWPRTVPLEECSELYRRYCDNPHIAAAFLKDFQVNDSVMVDVTLLEAKDSLGWVQMRTEFRIADMADIPEDVRHLFKTDEKSVGFGRYPKGNETGDEVLYAFSRKERMVSLFHTKDESEIEAIFSKKIDEVKE